MTTSPDADATADLAELRVDGKVARLILNRVEKRNALSLDLLAALHAKLDELGDAPEVNTLIVEGAGKAFCAGMDLKAVLREPGEPLKLLTGIAELTIRLRTLPAVVVAKAHGAAIGGGCGLAVACDIVMTHPEAKLGFPEVDLGVCPAVVAPWLVAKVGGGRARRILLQGGTMSGHRACALGIADDCVPSDELDAACDALAARLSKAGHQALAVTKGLLNELDGDALLAQVREGATRSADVIAGDEAQQKLDAIYG
jgi:methylglutaconyl-CoA hydratase